MEVRCLSVWGVAVVVKGYGWVRRGLCCLLVEGVGLGVSGGGRGSGVPGCSVFRKSGNGVQLLGGSRLQEGQGSELRRSSAVALTAFV